MDVRAAGAFEAGKGDIDDPITHTMPLDRIDDTFALMHKGDSIRSVVAY